MFGKFFKKVRREERVKSKFARLFNSPTRQASSVKKLHKSGRFI